MNLPIFFFPNKELTALKVVAQREDMSVIKLWFKLNGLKSIYYWLWGLA